MPCEVPWLLTIMFACGLAAKVFRSLIGFVSVSVSSTGLAAAFNAFTHSVANHVKDNDSAYIADWE